MEFDMAPPNKRRRLSSPHKDSKSSQPEYTPTERFGNWTHSVEALEHKAVPSPVHTVPQRIEEIHLQIQERAAPLDRNWHPLHRRQGTGVASVITTTDSLGNSIVSTVSSDPAAASSATASGTTSSGTPVTGSGTSATATGTTARNTFSASSESGGSSKNGTVTDHGTQSTKTTDHGKSTAKSTHTTTLPAGEFIATLKNGHVVTITQSKTPYVTTFGDGQIATICALDGQCAIHDHDQTQGSHKATTSDPQQKTVTSLTYVPGATIGQPAPSAPTSSSTPTVSSHHNGTSSTPPAGTIAGGAIGGAAGVAILALVAFVVFRWYRRRSEQGHRALPAPSYLSSDYDPPPSSTGLPGMAERAGLRPLAVAIPGIFRHQNRSQEISEPSERGFQKVSGRKLPSQFSEGMSSYDTGAAGRYNKPAPAPGMPLNGSNDSVGNPERNLSSHSFYRDSYGFYGGEGAEQRVQSPDLTMPSPPLDGGEMTLSPGPRRTPTVHAGGPYNIANPGTPTPLGNSHHSYFADYPIDPTAPSPPGGHHVRSDTPSSLPSDNRSSRFTEEV